MKNKMVLFVCKGNRYRSGIAEEIFNKNQPKDFIAKSAGVTYQKYNDRIVPKILNEIGIRMNKRKPRKISKQTLNEAFRIIVFDGVDIQSEKVEAWPIKDCHAADVICIRKGRKRIEKLVNNLIESL